MGGTVRKMLRLELGARLSGAFGAVAFAALLAGCSTDISRFDYPAFGLTSDHPQGRPTPPVPMGDSAEQLPADGVSPRGAPPPDYNNPNFGDTGPAEPRYPYRGAASAAPAGFGTVPGQPESYHPERLASNGRTAYIIPPSSGLAPVATDNPAAARAPLAVPPAGATTAIIRTRRPLSGSVVEVLPGETLYQFSRRNGVSIAAVMQANNLRTPMVQPGDKLIIPGKGGRSILPPTASAAPTAPASTAAASPPAQPAMSTAVRDADDNPDGSYTVRAGDSVYGIARKHNVRPEDIMAINGITDVTKVKFGQVLKMPGAGGGLRPLASLPAARRHAMQLASLRPLPGKTAAAPVLNDAGAEGIPDDPATQATDEAALPLLPPVAGPPGKSVSQPMKARNAPVDPASAPRTVALAEPIADAGGDPAAETPSDGRFRWPVRGRIIGKFGPAGKAGQPNEGIDLAVPLGTEVHAAENGVVAYAGDELKGYGKLVLIRHADNWVTAYAHNDELLVKHGDQIRRGQVIAKAGKSGGIDQPLLHFELRKGSQPVDPMPHMASN